MPFVIDEEIKPKGRFVIEDEETDLTKDQSFYSKYIRKPLKEFLEIGGAVAGGVAGLPGAVATGGVLPAVTSGLGYVAGKKAGEAIDVLTGYEEPLSPTEQITSTAKDIQTGVEQGIIGEATGLMVRGGIGTAKEAYQKGAKFIKEKVGFPITQKSIKEEAARRLEKAVEGTPTTKGQIQRNILTAQQLEKKIPGLKFTAGQLTDDASAISLERALARSGGADLSQEQRAIAAATLDDYYNTKVVQGGKAKDYVDEVLKQKTSIEGNIKNAENSVDLEVKRLQRHMDIQSIGKNIHQELSQSKSLAREKANDLYEKIPNVPVKTRQLYDDLANLKAEFDPQVENPANFPKRMIDGFESKITTKTKPSGLLDVKGKPIGKGGIAIKDIGYQDLRKMRSQVSAELRTQRGSATPNNQLIRRLEMLKDSIEKAEGTVEGPAKRLHEEASNYYRIYSTKYKQGTVADVLSRGKRGEDTRIALANIADAFNSLDGIDQFKKAVGNNELAKSAMHEFYQYDFMNNAFDAEGNIVTKKAYSWLSKNIGKLNKLGITRDFKDVITGSKKLDMTRKELDIFNKSIANRVLEADADEFVSNAFKGSKNVSATAQELLNKAKGNKAAISGLKSSFAKFLMKNSELTGTEFFQTLGAETVNEVDFIKSLGKMTNNIKKYSGALRVIYKDEPQKVKAIHDVWNSYNILSRTAKSSLGAGTDTAEHWYNIIIGAAGARAGQYYLLKSVRDAISKHSENTVRKYLTQAMFNPEYAENLLSIRQLNKTSIGKFETLLMGLSESEEEEQPK